MALPAVGVVIGWSVAGAAVAGAYKLFASGTEDLADSSIKLTASALALGAGYIVAKKMRVI